MIATGVCHTDISGYGGIYAQFLGTKNSQVLQVGVKPVRAKLEMDTLTHMLYGRRLVGVIEGDRDAAEALPESVKWSKDGFLLP